MSDITNTAVKAMVVLRKAYRTIDAKTSESFKEDDLTQTQFSVLDVLYSKGPMKIAELIDSILATSGNMTVVIRNMEKKGWVTRHTCPDDKRAYLVTLTDAGRQVIERALLNDPRIDSGVFEHLDSRRMARVIWRSLFDSLRSDVEVFDDFLEVLSLALYGPSDL